MKKYILSIKDLSSICIYTDIESVCKKIEEEKPIIKTIPVSIRNEGLVNNIVDTSDYISILRSDNNFLNINRDLNVSNLFINPDDIFFPDIVYLLIGMLANQLQTKNYYFIQSSVVQYDDQHSIMLLGDPNSGKTTMAYTLMKELGYKLIANDNVLVTLSDKGFETYTGTKSMQMRYGVIKNCFPEIDNYLNIPEQETDKNIWDMKVYVDDYLSEMGYQYSDKSIITDIYNIKVTLNGNTYIQKRESIDELLLIYEHLTKQIRSNRYAFVSLDKPLPSFEKEEYMQNRYDMAKKIKDVTNIYDMHGTAKVLTKKIGDYHGK